MGELADRPEERGAQKCEPVVLAPIETAILRLLETQTGKAGIGRQLSCGRRRRYCEISLIIDERAGLAVSDSVDLHRFGEPLTEVEEGDRKPVWAFGEQGIVGVEANLAPLLVVDLGDDVGGRGWRVAVRRGGELLRRKFQGLEGKRLRRAESEAGRGGPIDVAQHCYAAGKAWQRPQKGASGQGCFHGWFGYGIVLRRRRMAVVAPPRVTAAGYMGFEASFKIGGPPGRRSEPYKASWVGQPSTP